MLENSAKEQSNKGLLLTIPRARYVNRSLRLTQEMNEDIANIAADKDMSFNAIAEALLQFALDHFDRTKEPIERKKPGPKARKRRDE